jgi:outer membrane immunogenic protein
MAADLPRRTPSQYPQPVYSSAPASFVWSGFYAGLNAGYGWMGFGDVGDAHFGSPAGFALGATAGFNHQYANNVVVGVEGDLNWMKLDTSKAVGAAAPYTTYSADVSWMWTARLRAGYAVERALLYVTAGYAGASIDARYSNPGDAAATVPVAASSGASDRFHHGWAMGLGLEYAFTSNVSMKGEYLYANLAEKSSFAAGYATKIDPSISLVRMGVNYRF